MGEVAQRALPGAGAHPMDRLGRDPAGGRMVAVHSPGHRRRAHLYLCPQPGRVAVEGLSPGNRPRGCFGETDRPGGLSRHRRDGGSSGAGEAELHLPAHRGRAQGQSAQAVPSARYRPGTRPSPHQIPHRAGNGKRGAANPRIFCGAVCSKKRTCGCRRSAPNSRPRPRSIRNTSSPAAQRPAGGNGSRPGRSVAGRSSRWAWRRWPGGRLGKRTCSEPRQ